MTRYLRISPKEGYIYQSFKEQNSEGTLKVVTGVDGKKYFHQVWADIKGTFIGVERKDFTARGSTIRQLLLKFKTDSDYIHVTLQLDDKYAFDMYFIDFVKVMGNLDKGMQCIFSTNTTKAGNNGKIWQNLYFTNTENNLPVLWSIDQKEIPAKEIKTIEGKPGEPDKQVSDFKARDKFIWKVFEKEYPRLEEVPFTMPAASEEEAAPVEKDDSLPF